MDDTVLTVVLVGAAALLLLWPTIRARLAAVAWVTAPEVKGRIDRGEDLLLLDVRTGGEFRGGHIPGAVHAPLDGLAGQVAGMGDGIAENRDAAVVVVCQSGPRAVRAATMLKKAGLSNVAVLRGGMGGWAASGLPVQRGT